MKQSCGFPYGLCVQDAVARRSAVSIMKDFGGESLTAKRQAQLI